jgi:hypothetical protein
MAQLFWSHEKFVERKMADKFTGVWSLFFSEA